MPPVASFPIPVTRERVSKFVNSYSHNPTSTRSLVVPDLSECVSIVKACMDAVKIELRPDNPAFKPLRMKPETGDIRVIAEFLEVVG